MSREHPPPRTPDHYTRPLMDVPRPQWRKAYSRAHVRVLYREKAPEVWALFPEKDQARSRVFVPTCPRCGETVIRFSLHGALAWRDRCPDHAGARPGPRPSLPAPPTPDELRGLEAAPPRGLEYAAPVWGELPAVQRRALHYWAWEGGDRPGAWLLSGFRTRQAFASAGRRAEVSLSRLLAAHYLPERDYRVKTRGRPGFDLDRFWEDFAAHPASGEAEPPEPVDPDWAAIKAAARAYVR